MITKLRETEIALIAKNEDTIRENADKFTVEDTQFLIQHLFRTGKSTNGVPSYISDILIDAIKKHDGWFIIRSKLAPVPFIKEGRGYIFTDEQAGQNVVDTLTNCGFHIELYAQSMSEEDVVQRLVRYGAKSISVNKCCNGIVLDAKLFPPPIGLPITWGDSEMRLNATVSEFVTQCDIGDDNSIFMSERKMVQAFNLCQLYFVSTPENPSVPKIEDSYADGYKHNCFIVFTDMSELRIKYPRRSLIIHREPGAKIFEAMRGAEFVLNPWSSNILLGENTINLCLNEEANYNKILSEVRNCLGENKDNFAIANSIVEYPDICDEFLAGLNPDGFEYSADEHIMVEKYTAEVLQRIIAENHVEAYSMLSKMRRYPELIQEILTGKQK